MPEQPVSPKPQTHPSAPPEPFYPDLCSLQAVLFQVLGTALLALVVTLMQAPLTAFDWPALGQISMLMLWITLSAAAVLCKCRLWLGARPPWLAGALSYLLVLTLAFGYTLAGQWLFWRDVHWSSLIKVLFIAAILGGVVLRYMYLQQQLIQQQQASNQAQINALQARIRPHFLFNSLNAVVSLIGFDPERAERVVLDLCDLFRAAIAEPALVSLARELKLARQYLEIEELRLARRLRVEWQLTGDLESCLIPSMTLQPILENAVYHGIEPRPEGGEIQVIAEVGESRVNVTVVNPLPEQAVARPGNGIAQANIRARLQAHFGNQITFSAGPDHDRYRVHLSYRWLEANSKENRQTSEIHP
ncbi:sensor histidine kinase [Halioxenophilus sp. WMMB6]|uniref:sensor histidine kinase n=1 Tax=Halioxenophilus sp. WMMB6 TaxID=3073815 RepID=UPI00295E744E|nr:histidine kinase [Halioxenophilus sp. WMMB6]